MGARLGLGGHNRADLDRYDRTRGRRRHERFPQTPYTQVVQRFDDTSMPRPEVLERIKTAESDADDIVAEAEADREERIAEARREAEEIRQEAEEEASEYESERLAEAREEIEEEREAILEDGEQARNRLVSDAEANTE